MVRASSVLTTAVFAAAPSFSSATNVASSSSTAAKKEQELKEKFLETKQRNPILAHFRNEELNRFARRNYQGKREYNDDLKFDWANDVDERDRRLEEDGSKNAEKAGDEKKGEEKDDEQKEEDKWWLGDSKTHRYTQKDGDNSKALQLTSANGSTDPGPKHEDKIPDARKLLYSEHDKLEAARVYGDIAHFAYYFVDLLVGSPVAQRTSVIVDTGSSLCGYPCAGCGHCGKHIDAAYDISKSESAAWIKCNNQCTCKGDKCSYYQGYTEGSAIRGFWFEDYARLGDTIQQNPAVKVKMGCHMSENKLFYTQKANGIFGLAGSGGNDLRVKPTILKEFLRDRERVNANIFSMCLAQRGGRLIAGGYNSTYHVDENAAISWVPLVGDSKFYVVDLQKMTVGDSAVVGSSSSAFGRTIVDSGTTYSYFQSSTYRNLKAQINTVCQSMKSCGTRSGRECYSTNGVTLKNVDEMFPKVQVTIAGVMDIWYPRSYLYQRSTNKWCITFDDNGAHGGSVLGASWMIDHNIIFDLENKKMGMANARCPWYTQRPRGPVPTDFVNGGVKPAAEKHAEDTATTTAPPATTTEPATTPAPTTAAVAATAAAAAAAVTDAVTEAPVTTTTTTPAPPPAAVPTKTAPETAATMPPIDYKPSGNSQKPTEAQNGSTGLTWTGWLPAFYDKNTSSDSDGSFGGNLLFGALSIVSLLLISYNCVVLCRTCKSRRNYLQAGNRGENPIDGMAGDQWLRENGGGMAPLGRSLNLSKGGGQE